MTTDFPNLDTKREALLEMIASYGRVAIAFSAGVDSAVVTKAAAISCGAKAVAVTGVSPSLASGELEQAERLATEIGIRHVIIRTDEFSDPNYVSNPSNRCRFCKTELYTQIRSAKDELQFDVVVNGANVDDLGDHRPGMQAANEFSVRSPLIEVGLGKAEVRELAKYWKLPVWDKPATPCLSSRIAYGLEVTPQRLRRVDLAEQFLKARFGIRELRVRHETETQARVEVPVDHVANVSSCMAEVTIKLVELGFGSVVIDPHGFRSGSMNAGLTVVELKTNNTP